jgi:DNA-directed RNA polymerase I, II, and III subunit RPABC1
MDDRIFKTLREMLTDRGLKGDTFEPVTPAPDETKMYNFGGMLIIYSTKTRVSTNDLSNFIVFAKDNNYSAGTIIISETPISEKVLSTLVNHISERENSLVQVFLMASLYFNISKHQLVPKQRIINDIERSTLAKKFPDFTKFPRILSQDAMAKYLGARPDDIVEVTGMCETTAENKRWRICVAETTNG